MRLIDNKKEFLDLDIKGYEFATYEPYEDEYNYDAQWLITKFTYRNNNYIDDIIGSYLMTFELYELISNLNRLYNNKLKKYKSNFTEDYIKIECIKKDNYFKLSIKVKDYLTNNKFFIEKNITYEELDDLITKLDNLYIKYPERA